MKSSLRSQRATTEGRSAPRHLRPRALHAGWIAALAIIMLGGCRGEPSSKPPVHLNPNMDTQDKYKAQRGSDFFADGRAMRPPVAGAVGRDVITSDILGKEDDRFLREDDAWWRGVDSLGQPIEKIPVPVTSELLARGRQRYNIFCAPCHDQSGGGQGTVVAAKAGLAAVPSYHQDYMRKYTDGFIFGVITHGSRSGLMSGYANQIPVSDRWAIVAYLRALQRAQNASLDDVPAAERGRIEGALNQGGGL